MATNSKPKFWLGGGSATHLNYVLVKLDHLREFQGLNKKTLKLPISWGQIPQSLDGLQQKSANKTCSWKLKIAAVGQFKLGIYEFEVIWKSNHHF